MVQLSVSLLNIYKPKPKFRAKGTFLDKLRIYVRGGAGGKGFPKYGGLGGKGGDVYLVAKENYTLKQVYQENPSKRFIASIGADSKRWQLKGLPGRDITIKVPTGIVVQTDTKRTLGDLNKPDSRLLVAKGADGGNPDTGYIGSRATGFSVNLDLKLIADVGLVGFPNAGKSTFLAAVSRANPKIANYPFTTIQPQLGVMEFEDHRQISVADLPGLIEGAHLNIGLGHRFLKHVERTKLHLFVVDVHGFRLGLKYPSRSVFETVMLLNKELELYKPDLVHKPAMLIVNKMDIDGSQALLDELLDKLKHVQSSVEELPAEHRPENFVKFDRILPISAKQLSAIDVVRDDVRTILDSLADREYSLTVAPSLDERRTKHDSLKESFDASLV
ncbi:GTP-binding protein 10-like [Tubulanus polymorphus]|uniref:GTP-binding protein 10-like n=1 Tax=Tubulanus polymorphus TaxID=672921 RepID=UPI003DA21EAB